MPTRILIAEDESILRVDLKEELERLGYVVIAETADGASAVALARELRPDLVIMCIRMPEMDGITAAGILTRERIAPVILVSALYDDDLITWAGAEGVMMYVTKPWRPKDMRPAIETALARYRDLMAIYHRAERLEERFETRKLIERAASFLINTHGLKHQEAYRRLYKLALNYRRPLREVAEALLLTEDLATDSEDKAK